MAKFGNKQMRRFALGAKTGVHSVAKIGSKVGDVAMGLGPAVGLAFGPEVGIPWEAGAMALKSGSNAIEKVSR